MTPTTGPVTAPRDEEETAANRRSNHRSTSRRAPSTPHGSQRAAPKIVPPGKMLAPWEDDAMSAARSDAKKKPEASEPAPDSILTVASEAGATEPADGVEPATAADGGSMNGAAETPGVGSRPNAWAAPMNALGGFIRAQRQLAKLSLRDMATMTSVSNAYLSQVERGLHQPSLKVLHSIADALQLSTEQLLSQAGWVTGSGEHAGSSVGGTEEAIRTDPRLTAEQRTALLGVYRSFVDGTA